MGSAKTEATSGQERRGEPLSCLSPGACVLFPAGMGAAGPQAAKHGWWWRDLSVERDLRIELSLLAPAAASELMMRMVTAGLAVIP